ncbi:MAG: hypothetical protein QOE17_582, partial [Gaiellales bacterium]|nr:hypothetical protein [Gaiellales bacterium]
MCQSDYVAKSANVSIGQQSGKLGEQPRRQAGIAEERGPHAHHRRSGGQELEAILCGCDPAHADHRQPGG